MLLNLQQLNMANDKYCSLIGIVFVKAESVNIYINRERVKYMCINK